MSTLADVWPQLSGDDIRPTILLGCVGKTIFGISIDFSVVAITNIVVGPSEVHATSKAT